MNFRNVSIITLVSLMLASFSYCQDCQDCKKRIVIQYDNEVTIPRPFANPDSIINFWDYYNIAGGVRYYLGQQDPTRDCITRFDGASFTEKIMTNNIKFGIEHANLPPAGEISVGADYLVYGVVSSNPVQSVTLKLETCRTRELAYSVTMNIPKGFNPTVFGQSLAASLGPLYETIMQFEMKKRNQGDPYAIRPKITITPVKGSLNANEKTTVDILMRDCDGENLRGRTLTLTASGGKLNSTTVTTDAQGKATVEFTAGSEPAYSIVTTTYEYMRPAGFMDVATVQPGFIQINDNRTSLTGIVTVSNTHITEYRDTFTVGHKVQEDETVVSFGVSLKNISTGFGGGGSQFIADPSSLRIVGSVNQGEKSFEHRHSEFAAAFNDLTTHYLRIADGGVATVPTLVCNVGWDTYTFNFGNITVNQNGSSTSVNVSSDPVFGMKSTTDKTILAPTAKISVSVQGKNLDTTINVFETTTNPALGITETITSTTIQKASTKNNVWMLKYEKIYDDVINTKLNFTEDAHWHQIKNVLLFLGFPAEPTGVDAGKQFVPESVVLIQNYPNPFNPTTTISYALPFSTRASLIITDVLGQRVETLVDEEQTAGVHEVTWNATLWPSGVYFYRLQAGAFTETKKLLLIR